MKRIELFIVLFQALLIFLCFADDEEEIFRDYCRPGLCTSGDGTHSGCLDGKLHNGQFQVPPCKPNTNTLMNLTQAEKDMIVDWHNYQRNYVACGGLMEYYGFRPACRMGAAQWDRELEATAYLHVTYCLMAHDKCRSTPKYPVSGQNLGWYYTNIPDFNYRNAIGFHIIVWYMEYQETWTEVLYNYTSEPWHPVIGHFMSSIHEKNVRLGCVLAYVFELSEKEQSTIFTCNYAFTNVFYTPTYSYCKKPASKCETGTDPKYPYLCSTNEKYVFNKGVKLYPYDGDDTEKYDCGVSPDIAQEAPDRFIIPKTTLKPGAKPKPKPTPKPSKPGKPGRPINVPTAPSKPSDNPVPDYEDHELDPHVSSSTQIWKENFYQKIPNVQFLLLTIFLYNVL